MVNAELLNRKDPLTGFHTKDGLNEYLSSKLTSVYDKPKKLVTLILDLDNFKGINDHYGHLVGDDALKHFSKAINIALKGQHFVARYGGDEFVIVMYNPSEKEDMETAKRIKSILEKERFYTPKGEYIKIVSSIGIAMYPNDGTSPRQLIESADQALYYAKKHGRGKIIHSKHLKAHSRKDKTFLIGKIGLVLAIVGLGFILYKGAESIRGITSLGQDIKYYTLFRVHKISKDKNFCYVELKDGKKLSGWILSDTPNLLVITMTKPTFGSDLLRLKKFSTINPIMISKDNVKSVINVLKK